MGTWEVRAAGDAPVAEFDDRVRALAHALVLRTGGGAPCDVHGPAEPACTTSAELGRRLVGEGRRVRAAGRGLRGFLHGWLLVGRELAGRAGFEPDEVAAMVAAAGAVPLGPPDPGWRTAVLEPVDEPVTFGDWEAIVVSQLADLGDLADAGPFGESAYAGLDAPRPAGARRATVSRWYHFDPAAYLESGATGSLGGRDDEPPLDWALLAELARCGQEYA